MDNTLIKTKTKQIMIEIHGLGYIGFPLAVRLAMSGFKVYGIDKDINRISRLKNQKLIESEIHLKDEFVKLLKNDGLIFSNEPIKTQTSKIVIVCVPTPIPNNNRSSDIYVIQVMKKFLENAKDGDVVIIESSVEVGTTEKIEEMINSKGFKVGKNIGVCFCPERVEPQNTEWRIENIPRIIYCSDDQSFKIAKEVYRHINNSNLSRASSSKIAEVVKSFENTFRLVNISLVNELAILCDMLKIDVKEIVNLASTKPFGFMPFYPGAGAGGHCIPKDPLFLLESSKKLGIEFKTLKNAIDVNNYLPVYIVNQIEALISKTNLEKSVIVSGLSYKPNIEDMRDSPGFKIIKELLKREFRILAFDPYFNSELYEKYCKENNLQNTDFEMVSKIDENIVKQFSMICIVQHHSKVKLKIDEIYRKSQIPLIYDCQNRLRVDSNSKTILKQFGN
jgi:UDP-N-acetyl-D-glucosamine dehydrogenase